MKKEQASYERKSGLQASISIDNVKRRVENSLQKFILDESQSPMRRRRKLQRPSILWQDVKGESIESSYFPKMQEVKGESIEIDIHQAPSRTSTL